MSDPDVERVMATLRGVPAHKVSQRARGMFGGIDWRGCSKGEIVRCMLAGDYGSRKFTADQLIKGLGAERPPMWSGARQGGKRATLPVLAYPYAFLPHPDQVNVWVRTHWSVLAVACSVCDAAVGELCRLTEPYATSRLTSTTHWVRRKEVRGKPGQKVRATLEADRRVRVAGRIGP